MTNGKKCVCEWKDDKVTAFCGAHNELHNTLVEPLIVDRARLEYIQAYAKTQHPLISSQACPLCTWEWEIDEKTGFGKGSNRQECGYHYALNQLYRIKILDEEE